MMQERLAQPPQTRSVEAMQSIDAAAPRRASATLPAAASRPIEELSLRRAIRLYTRGLSLRCPHCGNGGLLRSWLKFKPKCEGCGLRTDRGEEDFFLGGMMWNIVMAEGALLVTAVLIGIFTWPDVPWTSLQYGGILLMTIVPFLFYPISLTVWLASDILIRPVTDEEMEWHRTSAEGEFRKFRER
jgi:uncharacterized protein (DUF983 family)